MIIEDPAVLAEFRRRTVCEWCRRYCPQGTDPHHFWFKRGMAGGGPLDHPWNLCSLCRGWSGGAWVSCHQDAEAGKITKYDLLAIVAQREGKQQAEIVAELERLRRLDGKALRLMEGVDHAQGTLSPQAHRVQRGNDPPDAA